jgi:hypothetical protein
MTIVDEVKLDVEHQQLVISVRPITAARLSKWPRS